MNYAKYYNNVKKFVLIKTIQNKFTTTSTANKDAPIDLSTVAIFVNNVNSCTFTIPSVNLITNTLH